MIVNCINAVLTKNSGVADINPRVHLFLEFISSSYKLLMREITQLMSPPCPLSHSGQLQGLFEVLGMTVT